MTRECGFFFFVFYYYYYYFVNCLALNMGVVKKGRPIAGREDQDMHQETNPLLLIKSLEFSYVLDGYLKHLSSSCFQALWNLSERIGLAKARGLSKDGKKSCLLLSFLQPSKGVCCVTSRLLLPSFATSVIDSIPNFRYSASSRDSSNGNCVVCMSDYVNREKLRRLPCNHDFHAKCIDRWLKVRLLSCSTIIFHQVVQSKGRCSPW